MKFDFQRFFRDYGAVLTQPEKLAPFYGRCLLVSAPESEACLHGGEKLLEALKPAAARFAAAGLLSAEPASVTITELDGIHRIAQVEWKQTFQRGEFTHLRRIYLLREEPHKVIILAHLSPESGI